MFTFMFHHQKRLNFSLYKFSRNPFRKNITKSFSSRVIICFDFIYELKRQPILIIFFFDFQIFIIAPTPPTPTAPIIPENIPDEHKTLVYVLVKKPDPQPQIEIPQVRPTEPSKPEVFFIKYKDDKKISHEYGAPPH